MKTESSLELHILEQTLCKVEQQIAKLESDKADAMKQGWLADWKRKKKEYEDKIDAIKGV